jgi:hypothetical protein
MPENAQVRTDSDRRQFLQMALSESVEAGSTKTIDDSARFSLVLLVSLPTDEGVSSDSRWSEAS